MNLSGWQRLLTNEGQRVLTAALALQPTAANLLSCHQRLRKQYPDDLVILALDTAQGRAKAKGKFTHAEQMYFTREGLEQSSGECISEYRAKRFAGFARVGDFCCGIGGDAIGLAAQTNVVAIDADELRLAMARENLRAYDRLSRAEFLLGDLKTMALPGVQAAFFDPDRRADGQRHIRIRDYEPNLNALRQRLPSGFPLGVKVAPGVAWNELNEYDAEKEFISVAGELKECVLWFGPLRTTQRRATVLPFGATLFAEEVAPPTEPVAPMAYLYDPDPAVIRSGLVSNLAEQLQAKPIDAEIAYLTSTALIQTPFARAYAIEEALPFHAKRIGARLKSLHVGPVTITKRGSAVDVDELRRKWKLKGSESKTVILTRVMGQPYALIGKPFLFSIP